MDDINYNPKRARDLKGMKDVKAKGVPFEPVDNEWSPAPYSAFKLILSARFAAALWTSISDCDETYNYWEPVSLRVKSVQLPNEKLIPSMRYFKNLYFQTHYLLYGKGFQTWEYSPVYALRSYTYLLMHAVPAKIYEVLLKPSPLLVFFFLRCFLAFISASTEVYLYRLDFAITDPHKLLTIATNENYIGESINFFYNLGRYAILLAAILAEWL